MFSNFSFSDVLHVLIVLAGGVFLFKKVAEMSRYHNLRVWALTFLLSCIVVYFFLAWGLTMAGGVYQFDDYIEFSGNATDVY